MIIYNVVSGERPGRPVGPNEWLSDDVWNLVSRCWSASCDERPDVNFAMNALNDAADAVEVERRKGYTTNDQGQGTPRRDSGASYENRSRTQVDSRVSEQTHSKQRIIRASSWQRTDSRSSPTSAAASEGFCDPVSIRRKNTFRLQGKAKGEEKYAPQSMLLSVPTNLLKDSKIGTLEHGTIPPAFTNRKLPL